MYFWILEAVLLVVFFGLFPGWAYNRRWGYGPSLFTIGLFFVLLLLFAIGWLPGWGAHPGWR